MNKTIIYRHNAMAVQSLDSFFNIKGGYHNGIRDVYFIRALGELPDMKSVILNIDQKMDEAVTGKRLVYKRISKLPKLLDDVGFYSKAYDEWTHGQPIKLKTHFSNDLLKNSLTEATKCVLNIYKQLKNSCSDTILKNYTVKLWFWCDYLLNDVFLKWTEKLSVKIVVHGVSVLQEYLFFYMITLLGCDVLILNNTVDIKVTDEIASLSYALKLGAFGNTELPEYIVRENRISVPKKRIQSDSKFGHNNIITNQGQKSTRIQSLETENTRKSSTNASVNSLTAPIPSVHISRERNSEVESREKSFEELARLASSIVMIAVHNNTGELTATGSGIVIGSKGFILTNYHVVKDGRFFSVRLEDDENIYPTDEIIKYNPDFDLAIIRIDKELKPLCIFAGRQKLQRGQKVVAIGSPLGLFNSVSDGIISGFRKLRDIEMIQFTAPISHGSSGGAVLNMQGEVIGISTAGIDSGQNINLAVDYETIRLFAKGFF